MPREATSRRHSTGEGEDQYLLFVHNIPKPCRWQELKDIVREYCGQHVSKADTIPPDHEFGHVLITGRKNALKAYDEFCDQGWHGKPIQVSLRGPIQQGRVVSGDMLASLPEVRPLTTYHDRPPPSPLRVPQSAANSYQVSSPAYAAPSFNGQKQYSRPVHEASSQRNLVTSSSATHATHDRPRGEDRWSTASDAHRAVRPSRGSFAPVQRSHATSQTALDSSRHRASRHGAPQRGSRPLPSARTPSERHIGQTIRLSNLPPSFSETGVYRLLEGRGDVQVASCRTAPGKSGTCIAYASFKFSSDAKKAVEQLNGRAWGGGQLAVTLASAPPSVAASTPAEDSRERRSGPTTAAQSAKGPLVVDGAKSVRPRYKGRHSPADSDASGDESHALLSDSEDGSGSAGSDRRVAAVTKKVASMRVDRR